MFIISIRKLLIVTIGKIRIQKEQLLFEGMGLSVSSSASIIFYWLRLNYVLFFVRDTLCSLIQITKLLIYKNIHHQHFFKILVTLSFYVNSC